MIFPELNKDTAGGTAMLKIGEFSKLSRISVRMLRHYDEIGLLKPAQIDRFRITDITGRISFRRRAA